MVPNVENVFNQIISLDNTLQKNITVLAQVQQEIIIKRFAENSH